MRCKVPQDITLVRTTTHQHARGTKIDSFVDPPSGQPSTMPFMTATNWARPPVSDAQVKIAAGSYVRTVSSYMGDDNSPAVQGQYKDTTEMCMTIAYHPEDRLFHALLETCCASGLG